MRDLRHSRTHAHSTQKGRNRKEAHSGASDEDFRMTLLFSPNNSEMGLLGSELCNMLLLLDPQREGHIRRFSEAECFCASPLKEERE